MSLNKLGFLSVSFFVLLVLLANMLFTVQTYFVVIALLAGASYAAYMAYDSYKNRTG